MPRPLLPPRGIHVPTTIVFHRDLSPSVIHTWIQLRALAWGQDETPQLSIPQLSELTSKSRSTIFGHMALLRQWGALRWRSSENGTLIVAFPVDTVEFYLDGDFLAPESEILESKNLEKLSPSLPSLINNFDLNDVEEREREEKDLDHSRGLSPALSGEIPVQNFGKSPFAGGGLQSKKPDKPVPHSLRGPRDVLEGMDSIQDFGCVPESKNLDGGGLPAELLSPQSGGDGADPIKIYRALTGIRPNKLQREHLTAQISDTNIWYASVEHWQSHGWNPKNIAGILQLYQRGGPSACRYCPQDDESQEDSLSILERMRAELKESSNGRS